MVHFKLYWVTGTLNAVQWHEGQNVTSRAKSVSVWLSYTDVISVRNELKLSPDQWFWSIQQQLMASWLYLLNTGLVPSTILFILHYSGEILCTYLFKCLTVSDWGGLWFVYLFFRSIHQNCPWGRRPIGIIDPKSQSGDQIISVIKRIPAPL